jgi:hypothetical protein
MLLQPRPTNTAGPHPFVDPDPDWRLPVSGDFPHREDEALEGSDEPDPARQ